MSKKKWEETAKGDDVDKVKAFVDLFPAYGDYRLRTLINDRYGLLVPREAIRRFKKKRASQLNGCCPGVVE